jgi:peptidoglycan/xylan/chitin deacetylase (PgdA/CDA1 family)
LYLIYRIKKDGHTIGNHGFDHLDGFFTSNQKYLDNIQRAVPVTSGTMFRPPFGRLRIGQYREIRKAFKIVFWDLMAYDFDRGFGSEKTLAVLKKMIRPGSVIVLHDSRVSTSLEFLERFILFAAGKGYRFEILR